MRYDLQVSQRPMCPRFVEAANRTEGTADRSTLSCMRRPKLLSQLDSAIPLLGVLVVVVLLVIFSILEYEYHYLSLPH